MRKWEDLDCPADFLAEATPGAGKTRFALELANRVRARSRGIPLSFVCPTAHLRNQWQQAAHQVGIELSTDVMGPRLQWGYSGLALTYQQVLSDPERFRRVVGQGWVALDECHHAGEGRSWAEALMHAFGSAEHRLSLSGTAFRSDACRIPFIRYDTAGVSEADYRYGYGEALRDGIVRPVYFVSFGGEMEWVKDGEVRRAAYAEAIPRDQAAARLRTALDPAGGWMEHTLTRAHRRLIELRGNGHPQAAGLVVCVDQIHARRIAARLRDITGVDPAIALSDDPQASATINAFTVGSRPWIVAVRQVSEGTDIPRLRVGIWATNASTELFFRQVVGRLVRVVPGVLAQDAYLYLPAEPQLLRHAKAIAEERSHQLIAPPTDDDEQVAVSRAPVARRDEDDFRALESRADEAQIVFGSKILSGADLQRAKEVALACGWELEDPVAFAAELREAAGPPASGSVPVELRRKALRSLLSRRVREHSSRTGSAHRDTYARLKRVAGRTVAQLDEAGLIRHIKLVEAWLGRGELRVV